MTLAIVLQFIVVLAAIWMGARQSGVGYNRAVAQAANARSV